MKKMTKFIESAIDLFGQAITPKPQGKYRVIIDFFEGTMKNRRAEVIQKVAPPDTYFESWDYLERVSFKTDRVKCDELMRLVASKKITCFTVVLSKS